MTAAPNVPTLWLASSDPQRMAASFEGANEPSLEPPNGRGHEPNERGETRRDPPARSSVRTRPPASPIQARRPPSSHERSPRLGRPRQITSPRPSCPTSHGSTPCGRLDVPREEDVVVQHVHRPVDEPDAVGD